MAASVKQTDGSPSVFLPTCHLTPNTVVAFTRYNADDKTTTTTITSITTTTTTITSTIFIIIIIIIIIIIVVFTATINVLRTLLVLRRTSVPKSEVVGGMWRKLHNKEHHNLYVHQNLFR